MKPRHIIARTHGDLEPKFAAWKKLVREKVPARGWIREIREALGMSARQLGKRIGLTQQSVAALEKAEVKGSVRLSHLRKAANALQCHFVYALVPKKPLRKILRHQAFGHVMPHIVLILHKNKIKLSNAVIREMVNKRIDRRGMLDKPHLLWNEIILPPEYMQPRVPVAPLAKRPSRRAAPKEKNQMSEESIAALPPGLRDMARAGKIVE